MNNLTVITPVHPEHRGKLDTCVASVLAQTVPVIHLVMIDDDLRGPGHIRNQLLDRVETTHVTFLDADDWLEPVFAEKALQALRPGWYVYTDWYQDALYKQAPPTGQAWCNGTFHLVTAVVETQVAQQVRFDGALRGMEDTDFWIRVCMRQHCGLALHEPLVHYAKDGGRSQGLHVSGEIEQIRRLLKERYGGYRMPCCGNQTAVSNVPVGEKQPNDVLAQAQWGGNRKEMGRATGRRYPRISYPKTTWVDPRDIAIAPNLWKEVQEYEVVEDEPDPDVPSGAEGLVTQLIRGGVYNKAKAPAMAVKPLPNINRVKRLTGVVDYPTFVAPYKDYPSFWDFWKLVELSGFERQYSNQIDLQDSSQTYIFVTPEGIPDCTDAAARTIFWQLEYAGDYTAQENAQTASERWSSDPAHAEQTGAKFVLLGSHVGLNPTQQRGGGQPYDVTMLAYMTERRLAIKAQLSDLNWSPDYPGHDGEGRHNVLANTEIMLHVHQHDIPRIAPLRIALAAAYKMLMISEAVTDMASYFDNMFFYAYGDIAGAVEGIIKKPGQHEMFFEKRRLFLYQFLCIDHPFGQNVLEALV